MKAVHSKDIRVTRRFRAPPERVFDAWLDPAIAARWLFATAWRPMTHVEIDARVAGSFCLASRRNGALVVHRGEYVEIAPHRRLVFTLRLCEPPHAVTRVTVAIAAHRAGCELALTHANMPPERVEPMRWRWTGMLYGLGSTLDA